MADFNNLKAAIRAAIYENEDQAITGDALQEVLLEMVTDINAAKQDALTPLLPLGFNSNGALQVLASRGIYLGGNGIEANIGWGLTWGGEAEDEIAVDDTAVQPIISDLATIRSGAAAGSTAYQLPAAGIPVTDLASAVQSSLDKVDTAVQSATISNILSLSQQDYDDLVDKDAATLYVII